MTNEQISAMINQMNAKIDALTNRISTNPVTFVTMNKLIADVEEIKQALSGKDSKNDSRKSKATT